MVLYRKGGEVRRQHLNLFLAVYGIAAAAAALLRLVEHERFLEDEHAKKFLVLFFVRACVR